MLAFGEVRPLAEIVNVGAVAGPLCLNGSNDSTCVFLARLSQIFHGLIEDPENIVLFWNGKCGFRYPHFASYSQVAQEGLLLRRDWLGMGGIEHGSQCLDYKLSFEVPFQGGLRNAKAMPDCDLEHERYFGKDEEGYRCGAGWIHDADVMLCKSEATKGRQTATVIVVCNSRKST